MTEQHATIRLTELRCDAHSEEGGCEPYLFTSFFALGDGEPQIVTPRHDDVREAFPNDVTAGQSVPVPEQLGSARLRRDNGQRIGVAALVIDEDLSREMAVSSAHQAFAEELQTQLQRLGSAPGQADEEQIREAVLSRVRGAIHGTYDYSDLHRDQDDHLGFALQILPNDATEFELPLGSDNDRFTLTGRLSMGD